MTQGPSEPRIPPLPSEGDSPPLNIFRTLQRNRPLAKAFLTLGGHLLSGTGLPPREREIVVLRVGWRCASEYEFGQHTVIGREAGLTDDEVARVATPGTGGWSPDDAALVTLADELCDGDLVSEPTWQALSARWSQEELLELLVLAGFYRLVSGVLNSVGVPLEPGRPGWPAGVELRRA
ncbi:MAG: hypothetical protein JWN57_2610, partial [Frankiales bacterium]|nr:hypothetical protein [Frankiales bacterium]